MQVRHKFGTIRLAMARAVTQHKDLWAPTPQQYDAIDLQALGYSLNAIARKLDIPQPTLWSWNNELAFSAQYRERVEQRIDEFAEARDAVHDQQVILALDILQQVLTGEMPRERVGDNAIAPLRYDAAVKLLSQTFWKQKAGGHQQFGAS